ADFSAESGYALFNAARRLTAAVTTIPSSPKLFILTRNAEAVSEDGRANPAHAVLWGLGRTLALEHPEIWGGMLDFEQSVPSEPPTAPDDSDDTASAAGGDIKDVWRTCEPERRHDLLRDHVRVLVAAVMQLPSPQALGPSADYFELGMDSLMSVILQRALNQTLGEELPATVVFDYPTVEALADYLTTIADADGSYNGSADPDLSERVS
ncbi:beta-ketoacyl reductase, partial [Mycobacterium sp. E2733]|uniref:beta-ketoacyl reductase n=1 Tax=Mycobacterium sp. E2733 TaxID=1834138 RepID=UPI000AF95FE4